MQEGLFAVMKNNKNAILGVLGGMGPLSSAEFLTTIYEQGMDKREREQDAPAVIVYSDPTFPDRTEALLQGKEGMILEQLTTALHRLCGFGVSKIVICCMTIHYLLPALSAELRKRIISLLDVIFTRIEQIGSKNLMICSHGSRALNLFQRHEQWGRVKGLVVFPDDRDQRRIHDLIYEIKKNRLIPETARYLETLCSRYEVSSFIVGCSEIHLPAKRFFSLEGDKQKYDCVDPFMIIAQQFVENTHDIE